MTNEPGHMGSPLSTACVAAMPRRDDFYLGDMYSARTPLHMDLVLDDRQRRPEVSIQLD